ncbi:MAG TPA: amidase [Alphaproteobacteria bacterium]|nr:amidase [Alphaproteobacteria bacterium]
MSDDLIALGAIEATAAIRNRTLRSSELVEACLARIEEREPDIHAFARLASDSRERARLADLAPLPLPLHGVPVAIKDIIDTADLGTEYGSPIFAGHVPREDANCVARLKAAGAIVIGKTVTTEFAHVTPQTTRNPRDPARTPGGSSSGSAAAVADGMVPVALGTQTGGSVIRPASYCGVFGFKSSNGRTDTRGVHELARSLDTVGWFARNALDLSLLGRILLRDGKRWPPVPDQPRLARAVTPYDSKATHAALRARDEACVQLAATGAEVATIELPADFGDLNAVHRRIVSVEASRAFARYASEHPEKLSPALTSFIAEGRGSEAGYEEARAIAKEARNKLALLMQDVDALVLPAATGEAPEGLGSTGDATFSLFLSLLGPPCATIPAASGDIGLPIGVQLVGRFNHDEELLALVEWAAARLL